MGTYYLIVNPDKREYLSADDFDENIKVSGLLRGLHGIAVSYLVCLDSRGRFAPLGGSWFGQRVMPAGDDKELTNEHGVLTVTPDHPDRNLYGLATAEYENISGKAMGMLALVDEEFAVQLAERAAKSKYMLISLGNAVHDLEQQADYSAGAHRLRNSLENVIGESWQQKYQAALHERARHGYV